MKCTDWTDKPLGYWFALAGKAIATEALWAEELRKTRGERHARDD